MLGIQRGVIHLDYNSLAFRLERLYDSIDRSKDGDILKYIHIRELNGREAKDDAYEITFDNGKDAAEKANILLPIISQLADLKDHLKNKMGRSSQKVEEAINNSIYLQIIMDLNNANKHGYPTKTHRSNRKPKLKNVNNSLVIPPQEQIGINLSKGKVIEWGKCYITIDGDVVDEQDNLIFHVPDLLSSATKAWEEFIKSENIA